jgi:hypothetical protein
MVVGQIREKVSAFVKQNQKTDDGATTTDESAQEETSSDE